MRAQALTDLRAFDVRVEILVKHAVGKRRIHQTGQCEAEQQIIQRNDHQHDAVSRVNPHQQRNNRNGSDEPRQQHLRKTRRAHQKRIFDQIPKAQLVADHHRIEQRKHDNINQRGGKHEHQRHKHDRAALCHLAVIRNRRVCHKRHNGGQRGNAQRLLPVGFERILEIRKQKRMLIARPVAHHIRRARRRRACDGDARDEADQPHHQIAGNRAQQLRRAVRVRKHSLGVDALHRRQIDICPQQERNPEDQLHQIDLNQIKDVILEHHEEQRNAVFRHIHLAVIPFARFAVI